MASLLDSCCVNVILNCILCVFIHVPYHLQYCIFSTDCLFFLIKIKNYDTHSSYFTTEIEHRWGTTFTHTIIYTIIRHV